MSFVAISKRDRERLSCQFAASIISAVTGDILRFSGKPDDLQRQERAADAVYACSSKTYLFEHTLVETFKGEQGDGEKFIASLLPLEQEMQEFFESIGQFVLLADVLTSPKRIYQQAVKAAAREWVTIQAVQLKPGESVEETFFGAHLTLLREAEEGGPGELWIARAKRDEDNEDARIERLSNAMKHLGKLETMFDSRVHSVGVLEVGNKAINSINRLTSTLNLILTNPIPNGVEFVPEWIVVVDISDGASTFSGSIVKAPDSSLAGRRLRKTVRELEDEYSFTPE